MKRALVLSGGGARAAYQVGVLQALAELIPDSLENPFPIICGTSAGAINALALAAHSGGFKSAVNSLAGIWQSLEVGQVYKYDWWDIVKGVGYVGMSLFNQGVGSGRPLSLLDNAPLWTLLGNTINFENLDKVIADRKLWAVSVSATGYTSGHSVSFFQGQPEIEAWARYRRLGMRTQLRLEHLIASSAIPTIFPAVRIDREYFGDGALRQLAPISPALHLGADALFVIGVSGNRRASKANRRVPLRHSPSMGQIIGHLFNSAFVDALDSDLEHLERMNELLHFIPEQQRLDAGIQLRPVDNMVISPTAPLDVIAGRNIRYLPNSLRFFLRAIGATARGGGATAASYLLFSNEFITDLMELGRQDALADAENIKAFFAER
ncbi:patatin-like phospholipase family protein [Cellvibrio japonicus]|uniref:Uvs083 n=1 Tax=Cellvibrio japonicus (strain Ueda107) TaxID=498211 RepID=B3PBA6_CELJU|nr:patatin-like phospholipase family protein [Cellvibrio japonicus]ACE85548.1 Uvs083 [Cellvibrio japonicus Ueda107]QEI11691.1 patatin-like phospholipase family protein [Cellvibrio japonicus]QEI15265.1 patatin-like phospholipase family protein [Cellvibrio japonicus]QEI18845.1 patatin-like phospholipase family protein [Cellvibrio japonicus]